LVPKKSKMNKKAKSLIISGIVISLVLIFSITSYFIFVSASPEDVGIEIKDYDANVKTHTYKNITITSPVIINCRWTDPNADWKLCEVVMAVTNKDITHDFIEKDEPMSDFKHAVTNLTVYTSPLYGTYQESVLNSTCYKEMIMEDNDTQSITGQNDDTECRYNITRYSFNDWKEKTKLDKYPKGSTLGVKLIFKSPIIKNETHYLPNQFNFSLFGEDYIRPRHFCMWNLGHRRSNLHFNFKYRKCCWKLFCNKC
jgi:hypothetical protein